MKTVLGRRRRGLSLKLAVLVIGLVGGPAAAAEAATLTREASGELHWTSTSATGHVVDLDFVGGEYRLRINNEATSGVAAAGCAGSGAANTTITCPGTTPSWEFDLNSGFDTFRTC